MGPALRSVRSPGDRPVHRAPRQIKSVKNQAQVMAFIEKYMWNLDFPALQPDKKKKK